MRTEVVTRLEICVNIGDKSRSCHEVVTRSYEVFACNTRFYAFVTKNFAAWVVVIC